NRRETIAADSRNRITCVRFLLRQERQISHRLLVQIGRPAKVGPVTNLAASHALTNSLLEWSFPLQSIGPRCRSCHFDLNCKQRSVHPATTKDLSRGRLRTSAARVCVAPSSVDLSATIAPTESNQ